MQACIYVLLHESEGQSFTLTDFTSKGLEFLHWRQAGLKLFVSTLWLFHKQDIQWHLPACHRGSQPPSDPGCSCSSGNTESCCGGETSVLGHSCVGGLQNRSFPSLLGLELPLLLLSSPCLLPPTATASFLPFDHFKSKGCHWNGVGAEDSNDLSFAHFMLFTCSHAAAPLI